MLLGKGRLQLPSPTGPSRLHAVPKIVPRRYTTPQDASNGTQSWGCEEGAKNQVLACPVPQIFHTFHSCKLSVAIVALRCPFCAGLDRQSPARPALKDKNTG